jgi:hypothetical protein
MASTLDLSVDYKDAVLGTPLHDFRAEYRCLVGNVYQRRKVIIGLNHFSSEAFESFFGLNKERLKIVSIHQLSNSVESGFPNATPQKGTEAFRIVIGYRYGNV